MLELRAVTRTVVECFSDPSALDDLGDPFEARMLRVAADQLMVVGESGRGDDLVAAARRSLGPQALVEEVTDGWAAWLLAGEDVRRAFSILSGLDLPAEGFVQGDVARVPVKVVSSPGRLELLVPSMWTEHLRGRIVRRCSSLGIAETRA